MLLHQPYFFISTARFDKIRAVCMLKSIEKYRIKRKDMKMCAKRDKKPGFDSEFDGITLKIKLRGEIDHHTAAIVRVNIDELMRSHVPRILSMDMSAVNFMDSSGLGLIMGRFSLMQGMGGEMYVLDPSAATERIMKLAGMEKIIKIKRTQASLSQAKEMVRNTENKIKKQAVRHRTGERGAVTSVHNFQSKNCRGKDKRGETK